MFEENYTAAEQRVLMFATFLFVGDVKDREGMAKGPATYIATLKTERDAAMAALQEIERHHVEQKRIKGRDESHSHTLAIVRAAISKAHGHDDA